MENTKEKNESPEVQQGRRMRFKKIHYFYQDVINTVIGDKDLPKVHSQESREQSNRRRHGCHSNWIHFDIVQP